MASTDRINIMNWEVLTNNGTNVTAKNKVTGENFSGLLSDYNNIFKQLPDQLVGLLIDKSFFSTQELTSSRASAISDNGKTLPNLGASPLTYTLNADMGESFSVSLAQVSTGTVAIVAGAGVTFVGATLITSSAGQFISAIYVSPNTYIIKVG